jgi:hypothetical protein
MGIMSPRYGYFDYLDDGRKKRNRILLVVAFAIVLFIGGVLVLFKWKIPDWKIPESDVKKSSAGDHIFFKPTNSIGDMFSVEGYEDTIDINGIYLSARPADRCMVTDDVQLCSPIVIVWNTRDVDVPIDVWKDDVGIEFDKKLVSDVSIEYSSTSVIKSRRRTDPECESCYVVEDETHWEDFSEIPSGVLIPHQEVAYKINFETTNSIKYGFYDKRAVGVDFMPVFIGIAVVVMFLVMFLIFRRRR